MNRRRLLTGVGAAGLAGLAGCAGIGGDDSIDSPEEVEIGIAIPLSGGLAPITAPIAEAAQVATRDFNDGFGDTRFSVDTRDTETNPEVAAQVAQGFIDDGLPAFVGPASSDEVFASADVAEGQGIVSITPSGTAPGITDLDGDYVLRTCPSDALQAEVLAEQAEEATGGGQTNVLHADDGYGQALAQAFQNAYSGQSTTVPFVLGQESYTEEINEALGGGSAQALVIVGFPDSGVQIFEDFYEQTPDSDLPIFVTDGLRDDVLQSRVGNDLLNVSGVAPVAQGPALDYFAEVYRREFNRGVGVFTAEGYDALAVLTLAAGYAYGQNGEVTREGISEHLRDVSNPGGETVRPGDGMVEGWEMALRGEDIYYEGASSLVNFDDNGDMEAVTYETFDFTPSGLEVTGTINFEA